MFVLAELLAELVSVTPAELTNDENADPRIGGLDGQQEISEGTAGQRAQVENDIAARDAGSRTGWRNADVSHTRRQRVRSI